MILKLKSLIYKYTGVFLAHKETNDYIDSKEYWKQFVKIAKHPKNDMSPRDIHGLLIGSWQAHHGFARPMSRLRFTTYRFKYPALKPLLFLADRFLVLLIVLKWDVQFLYRKLVPRNKKS